jgi:arylsulfatase A-like enzyme
MVLPPLERRSFAAHTLCVTALLVAACTAVAGEERPNIVLLIGDDHGWDETGYNGHPHLRTPALDAMAAAGLRLDRFHAAHPSCSPTRGSVITGRHPVRYGTFAPNWSLRPEEIGIAEILGAAGYACGHFGKWHLGPVKADSPTNPGAMGFDEWVSHDNFFEMDPVLSHDGGPPEVYPGEGSAVIVEQAIRFIERARDREQPYFVMICFGSPHEPYSGLEHDLAPYADLPERYRGQTFQLTSNETGLPTTRPLGEVLRERYAEITAMDRAIGQLRRWLAERGLREDTLLWYFSDNGSPADGAVTSPLRGHKAQMYEGGLRVPSVLEWPARIDRPRATDVNAVTSDLLPTLCDLLDLPLPDRPLDGVSLKPLLIDGVMTERPRPIGFWEYDTRPLPGRRPEPYIDPALQQGTTPLVKRMGDQFTRTFQNVRLGEVTERDFEGARAILDNRFKLVVGARRGGEVDDESRELFDLRDDPAEEHNLIDEEPEIAKELGRQLREWQESVLHSLAGSDYP